MRIPKFLQRYIKKETHLFFFVLIPILLVSVGVYYVSNFVFAYEDAPAPQNLSASVQDVGLTLVPAFCSNEAYSTQEECEMDRSYCSDPAYTDQTSCEAIFGLCSDFTSGDQATCESQVAYPASCSVEGPVDQATCETTIISGGCTDGVSLNQTACQSQVASPETCSDPSYYDQASCESSMSSPGGCSDGSSTDQSSCESSESGGSCTDGVSTDAATCASQEAGGFCSAEGYDNRESCEGAGESWTSYNHTWTPTYHIWNDPQYNTWSPASYHSWNGDPSYATWNPVVYHQWDPSGGGGHTWNSEPGSSWYPDSYERNGAYLSDGQTRYYRIYSVIGEGVLSSTYADVQVTDTTSESSYDVYLDWDDVPGVSSYVVVGSEDGGSTYTIFWNTNNSYFTINGSNYSDFGILSDNYTIYTPPARTLYYNNANGTGQWDDLANWFNDSGFTDPAESLPRDGETVYVEGLLDSPTNTPLELAALYISQINDGYGVYNVTLGTISVIGDFNVGSHTSDTSGGLLGGNITVGGTARFYSRSFNSATINGNAIFYGDDSSLESGGNINGNRTRYYSPDYNASPITPERDFTGWYEIVADGQTVDLRQSTNYGSAVLTTLNSGQFQTPAIPRTLYYNNAQNDGNWDNIANWWNDADYTDQAGNLPRSVDTVHVRGVVSSTESAPYVSELNVEMGAYEFNIPIYVNGDARFQDGAYLGGSGLVTAFNVFFSGSNGNYGTVNGTALFSSATENAGTVNGNALFYQYSTNAGTVTGNLTRYFNEVVDVTDWDFTGWYELIADGVTIDLSEATGYESATLTETNGGLFIIPDTTPPSVSITSLSNGATISDTVTVSATASDDRGVVGVKFFLDSSLIGAEDTSSPYGTSLDTTAFNNGSYNIRAVARDLAGNISTSTSVNITISNTDPEPPDTRAPVLSEITPITTPTTDTTPDYTFSSDENGEITYGGACTSDFSNAFPGEITVTFTALDLGTYSNCTITVTDYAGNASTPLTVSEFTIVAPTPDPDPDPEPDPGPDTDPESNPDPGENIVDNNNGGSSNSGGDRGSAGADSGNNNSNNSQSLDSSGTSSGGRGRSGGSKVSITSNTPLATLGTQGEDVTKLQDKLVERGFLAPDSKFEKGTYDIVTDQAYRQYLTVTEEEIVRQDMKGSEMFTQNLKLGDSGEEVRKLQKFLNKYLFFVAPEGPGSPGEETDYFGERTLLAVIRLQRYLNLPATGYFGEMTRMLLSI